MGSCTLQYQHFEIDNLGPIFIIMKSTIAYYNYYSIYIWLKHGIQFWQLIIDIVGQPTMSAITQSQKIRALAPRERTRDLHSL